MNNIEFIEKFLKKFGLPNNTHIPPFVVRNSKALVDFDVRFKTNFSQQYVLPHGLDSDKLWGIINVCYHVKMPKEVSDKIQKFLKEEVYIPLTKQYIKLAGLSWVEVLHGVASEYNEDDIIEWCLLGGMIFRKDEFKVRKWGLENKIGYQMQYVPSEKTLTKMEKHFSILQPTN